MSASPPHRTGRAGLAVFACLAVASAAGLTTALVTCAPPGADESPRPLSAAEAHRLAAMRQVNYRDGPVGLRATLGPPGAQAFLGGWVDWKQALVYVAVSGPGAGAQRGLLQARPGIVAMWAQSTTRTPAPTTASGLPPAVPPIDGWRVRRFTTAGAAPAPLDSLVALLFAMGRDRIDPSGSLAGSARWLGRGRAGGTDVDVLLGPALPPTVDPAPRTAATATATATGPERPTTDTGTATGSGSDPGAGTGRASARPVTAGDPDTAGTQPAASGGRVRYWLDSSARLHRFEALLAVDVPVVVDLDRYDRAQPLAIAALGGRPGTPRAVTAAEARLLSGMRRRNQAEGGAEIRVALPAAPQTNLRARGWVDWHADVAYLGLHDIDRPDPVTLVRADRTGVAYRPVSRRTSRAHEPLPPLPPPGDRTWSYRDWGRVDAAPGGRDLDLLLNEVLSLAAAGADDRTALRAAATWLRTDTVNGAGVSVFEIPRAGADGVPIRLRYWVDRSGGLRRLELRTRVGAFAQVDFDPGRVPYVRPVPIA